MSFNHLHLPHTWQHNFSKYPGGHTILESLTEWVSQVDAMIDTLNLTVDQVNQVQTWVQDQVEQLYTQVVPENIEIVLTAWKENGSLQQMIAGTVFDSKTDTTSTITTLKASYYNPGSIVQTTGFHTPGDGGQAKYLITDDPNLSINNMNTFLLVNGLKASLFVENDSVGLAQLGAKGDYNSTTKVGQDIKSILNQALTLANTVTALTEQVYLMGGHVIIGSQKTLIGNNASIYTHGTDGFHIMTYTKIRPRIENLTLRQGADYKKFRGIHVYRNSGDQNWSSNVTLENVYIYDYGIGILTESSFASDLSHVYPQGCAIGFYIGGTFGNQTSLRNCFAYMCGMGIVVENQKNLSLEYPTVEDAEYGIIIDGSLNSDNVKITRPWFENIRQTYIAYGRVDKNTYQFTEDNKQNERVKIEDPRYENIDQYGGDINTNSFTSVYRDSLAIRNLLKTGLVYKNYGGNWIEFSNFWGGSSVYAEKQTPWGTTDLIGQGIGLQGGFTMGIDCDNTFPYKVGDVVLAKFLIHSSHNMGVYPVLKRDVTLAAAESTAHLLRANNWHEVAFLTKIGVLGNNTVPLTIQAAFFDYNTQTPHNIMALRPTLTNLSDLGIEPDVSLNTEIQGYFPWVARGTTGRTV